MITQKELGESTKNAIEEEELRKKRIQERQQLVCILIYQYSYKFDFFEFVHLNILV